MKRPLKIPRSKAALLLAALVCDPLLILGVEKNPVDGDTLLAQGGIIGAIVLALVVILAVIIILLGRKAG